MCESNILVAAFREIRGQACCRCQTEADIIQPSQGQERLLVRQSMGYCGKLSRVLRCNQRGRNSKMSQRGMHHQ